MILVQFFLKFRVLGILCRFFIDYFSANHLNVNISILIIWIREESSAFYATDNMVSVQRGFFFLLVLGQAALFYSGPPWAFHIVKLLKIQILDTC